MEDLLIFWGNGNDVALTWKLDGASSKVADTKQGIEVGDDEQSHLNYQLTSETILKADLNCLADMAVSKRVSLVLSSQDIVSTELDIPNRNPKLMKKAIPFMMEEDVATPVDSLFYAYKDFGKDKPLKIRGIDKKYLESLISQFELAEIKLEQIILEQDLILVPEEGFSLLLEEFNCSVISSHGQIWHCNPDDFSWLIQKQLLQLDDDNLNAEGAKSNDEKLESDENLAIAISLHLYSCIDSSQFIRELPVGRFAVKEHPVDNKQDFLTDVFSRANAINLLQDEYEPKKEKSQVGLFLTKIASIAATLFIVFIIFQSSKIFMLNEQKNQLDERKMTLYKQAFPDRKKPRSATRAVKNMRDYIKSIGSSSDSSGFLKILNSSSQSLNDLTKVYPTNISYDIARNELRLDLIASNLIELDKFADKLKSSGHKVERSSETQRGEGFSSRLTIRN